MSAPARPLDNEARVCFTSPMTTKPTPAPFRPMAGWTTADDRYTVTVTLAQEPTASNEYRQGWAWEVRLLDHPATSLGQPSVLVAQSDPESGAGQIHTPCGVSWAPYEAMQAFAGYLSAWDEATSYADRMNLPLSGPEAPDNCGLFPLAMLGLSLYADEMLVSWSDYYPDDYYDDPDPDGGPF